MFYRPDLFHVTKRSCERSTLRSSRDRAIRETFQGAYQEEPQSLLLWMIRESFWVVLMKFSSCLRKFEESYKKVFGVEVSGVCWDHFKGVSRKFSGGFRFVFKGVWSKLQRSFKAFSREFPEGFKEVLGCFINVSIVCRVIEVYGNCEGVSKNFCGVLGKFHECHMEISRVFQECFTVD